VGVAGGYKSATLYNPTTGKFKHTAKMKYGRYAHTATLLEDGTVLVTGGSSSTGALNSAEIYDPVAASFTVTAGAMTSARQSHTATLLNDGTVLIAGGDKLGTAEIYNPMTKLFTPTVGPMTSVRSIHTATLLNNGMVLIAGGLNAQSDALQTAELYDPSSGTFSLTGVMSTQRAGTFAALVSGGQVLVGGGYDATQNQLASAELYNPVTGVFTLTAGPMSTGREFALASFIGSTGQVLVAGGDGSDGSSGFTVLNTAELYEPVAPTISC
jgi:hypothetical protein